MSFNISYIQPLAENAQIAVGQVKNKCFERDACIGYAITDNDKNNAIMLGYRNESLMGDAAYQ